MKKGVHLTILSGIMTSWKKFYGVEIKTRLKNSTSCCFVSFVFSNSSSTEPSFFRLEEFFPRVVITFLWLYFPDKWACIDCSVILLLPEHGKFDHSLKFGSIISSLIGDCRKDFKFVVSQWRRVVYIIITNKTFSRERSSALKLT